MTLLAYRGSPITQQLPALRPLGVTDVKGGLAPPHGIPIRPLSCCPLRDTTSTQVGNVCYNHNSLHLYIDARMLPARYTFMGLHNKRTLDLCLRSSSRTPLLAATHSHPTKTNHMLAPVRRKSQGPPWRLLRQPIPLRRLEPTLVLKAGLSDFSDRRKNKTPSSQGFPVPGQERRPMTKITIVDHTRPEPQ